MDKCRGCFGAANNDCKNCSIMKNNYDSTQKKNQKIPTGIPALITAAEQYLRDNSSTMQARDITGTSPEGLYELVAQGQPVVVLVTISMADRWETQGWYTEAGTYVEWSQNDHGAVLTGYTEATVTIADPLEGMKEYPKEHFEHVYLSRGSKALSFGHEDVSWHTFPPNE
ncbi:MAG: C39 family peptidase [Eubacteriales bacterium]|nr:C39 family peptidase [Eubacteriales bacterium]